MGRPQKGEAEDAKDKLGGIPLSLEEMAILSLPQIPAFLALIYLCNQRKHLSNLSVNLSWTVFLIYLLGLPWDDCIQ